MRKYPHWFYKLPIKLKRRIIKLCKQNHGDMHKHIKYRFLQSMFLFSKTKEGWNYWNNMTNKVER